MPSLLPANQLAWYAAVGKDYSPDLVIQFSYGSMAVSPDFDNDTGVTQDGFLFRKSAGIREKAFAMIKNSAFVFYTWVALTNLNAGSKPTQQIAGAGRPLQFHGDFGPTKDEVTSAMRYYRSLKETVAASGAKLLIVFFPLNYVVHPEDIPRWQHLGVTDIGRQIEFNKAFCDFVGHEGLECLNVTEDLRTAGAGTACTTASTSIGPLPGISMRRRPSRNV